MYLYNEQPEGLRIPDVFGLDAQTEQDVRNSVWAHLLLGDADLDTLDERVAELTDLPADSIRDLVEFMIDARVQQQARWNQSETATNLDRAFAELADLNVLALQDFTCCGNCAAEEIPAEFDGSRNWIGGVYFHRQDTEVLIHSDRVCLGFGARIPAWISKQDWDRLDDPGKEAAFADWSVLMMTQVVIPVLLRNGIDVDWDERFDSRPVLSNAHFYRTLTATPRYESPAVVGVP